MEAEAPQKQGGINIIMWLEIFGFAVAIYLVFRLLRKFNLLGTNEDTQNAKALGTDIAFNDTVSNLSRDPKNKFLAAIKKKFGPKPSTAQINSLLPNDGMYSRMMNTLDNAKHIFTFNDAEGVLGVFRQLSSQFEINFFATHFSNTRKKDMYKFLDKTLSDSDLSLLRNIINNKPLI